jgi:hypothetical protein
MSCPFCAHPLADAFASCPLRVAPLARLGRAATFAFGVLAISQSACTDKGRSPADGSIPADAAIDQSIPNDADDDGGVAIYAAAPTKDAGPTTTSRG